MLSQRLGPIIPIFAALAILPTSAQDATPTIRSSSELVIVPVVVKNHKGHVAPGLKQSDFSLSVDGKPQAITHFEEVQSHGPAVLRKPEPKTGEYSNVGLSSSRPVGLTVILLDLVNTPYEYQSLARTQLIGYLA